MNAVEIIAIVIILLEAVFTLQVVNNYRYASRKAARKREGYRPRCVLIVPCKGLDEAFDRNIRSFFEQDYKPYRLWFVVESPDDPAFQRLTTLRAAFAHPGPVIVDVRVEPEENVAPMVPAGAALSEMLLV